MADQMESPQKKLSVIFFIMFICFTLPLIAYAFMGTFSRMTADDYCSAFRYRDFGTIGYVVNNYMTWSGRYSAALLDALAASFGPEIIPFSTIIVLLAWFIVSILAFIQIPFSRDLKKRLGIATILSSTIMFTTLSVTPNIDQSLYWMQGMHALIPSFICSTAFLGAVMYTFQNEQKNKWRTYVEYIFCFLLPFISSGFSEVYASFQVVAIFVVLCLVILLEQGNRRKQACFILLLGLSGAILGLAVLFFAPGNAIRESHYPPHPPLFMMLQISLVSMRQFFSLITSHPYQILATINLFFLSALIGTVSFRNSEAPSGSSTLKKILLPLMPLISIFLAFICFIPGAYAESSSIPQRTMVIPAFEFEVSLAAWGFTWGSVNMTGKFVNLTPKKRVVRWAIIAILCLNAIVPIYSSIMITRNNPQLVTYSNQWDTMNEQILQAKKQGANQVVVANQIDWAGLTTISHDPKYWINYCVTSYYGLQVTTK